jgi:uncharacterized repeat protein (TIGR02543 family)
MNMKKEKTYSRTRIIKKLKKRISSVIVMAFMIFNLVTHMMPMTAYAASVPTSYKNAGTGEGASWTNPGNITAQGFPYANDNIVMGDTSSYLVGTNYDFNSIPQGARIDEISVIINRYASNNGSVKDFEVYLVNSQGTCVGINKAKSDLWTSSMGNYSYTWTADELSAVDLTLADIKNPNFGVALSVENTLNYNKNISVYVDYMKISVTYTTDTTAPSISTVSGNAASWQNTDVTLEVNATDDSSGISATESYSFDNGITWQDSSQKTFSSNQTVNIKVKDSAGNISEAAIVEITKIDKIAPTTPTLSADTTAPTNQNLAVTIAYSEDSATKDYRVAGGDWTAYTVPIIISSNALVEARGIDEAGNESPIGSLDLRNIDSTVPTLTLSQNPFESIDGSVTITPVATDDYEIDESSYKYVSGDHDVEYFENRGTTFKESFEVTANGIYTVYVKDKAGNESVAKITVSNINTYTVTFKDYNGDTLKTQSGMYSWDKATSPDVPRRTGYTFEGWFTDSALTIPYDFETLITEDLTLYAKWNIITGLTVSTTNSNGNVDGLMTSYTYGDRVTLTAVPDTNYKFISWTDSAGRVLGTNEVYSFVITQNTSITANFAVNTLFTVTFCNEANQIINTQTVVQGEDAAAPADPRKPNFTFGSWDKAFTNVQSDLKIYPIFKANHVTYTLTVINGTGSGDYSASTSVKVSAELNGKQFGGWKDEAGNIVSYNQAYSFIITRNMILTAVLTDAPTKALPQVTIDDNVTYDKTDPAYVQMYFLGTFTVPTGYQMIACGFVSVKNVAVNPGTGLTLQTSGATIVKATTLNKAGQVYRVIKTTYGSKFYVRGYMTYKNTVTGEIITIYSSNVVLGVQSI